MVFAQETTHFLGERGSINIQLTPGELTNRFIEIIIEWMSNQAENEKKDSAARLDINSPHDRLVEKFLHQENETARSLFREYLPKEIADILDLDTLGAMGAKGTVKKMRRNLKKVLTI